MEGFLTKPILTIIDKKIKMAIIDDFIRNYMKILFFFIFIYSSIGAKIIEIKHFSESIPYLTKDTIFILDIDDTLLVPKQMLGSDMWFEDRIKQQKGLSSTEAFEKTLNEWEGIRHFTQMQIVEPGVQKIIEELQKKSI